MILETYTYTQRLWRHKTSNLVSTNQMECTRRNSVKKNKRFFWCFDERNSFISPTQRDFFYNTIKQTTSANVQSVISTHSTIFVDKTIVKVLIKSIWWSYQFKYNSVDDIFWSLRLKNSDFYSLDKFIVVEECRRRVWFPHCFKL
jgi:hypothetical protein